MANLASFNGVVTDTAGNSLSAAQVTVTAAGQSVQVYASQAGAPLSNPFNAGPDGSFVFFAPTGVYDIAAVAGANVKTWQAVNLVSAEQLNSSSGANPPTPVPTNQDIDAFGKHVPFILNLPMGTQNFEDQTIHPDVRYIKEGFGPQKFIFWLGVTPYVFENDQTENPNIFGSRDGLTWEIPTGAPTPIFPSPGGSTEHYSDVDIVFHNNELLMYFRRTNRTTQTSIILLSKSSDGVTWTAPITVTGLDGSGKLSPSVEIADGVIHLWIVPSVGLPIDKYTSADGVVFSKTGQVVLDFMPSGKSTWHIDVIKGKDGVFHLVSNFSSGSGGAAPLTLSYYRSVDGINFQYKNDIITPVYRFEQKYIYRGSLVQVSDVDFLFYYSAVSLANRCKTAVLPCRINTNGELIPLNPQGYYSAFFDTITAPSAYIGKLTVDSIEGGSARVCVGILSDTEYPRAVTNITFNRIISDSHSILASATSVSSIVVPSGYTRMKVTMQINRSLASGVSAGYVNAGMRINGLAPKNQPLVNLLDYYADSVPTNQNGFSGEIRVKAGDVITFDIHHSGAASQLRLQDSSWVEVEFY